MSTVAAVIPHYPASRGDSLNRAVEALLGQTHRLEEIVIWDNADAGLVFRDERVRVIRSPSNLGCWARFLAAVTCATDYIFFQDNDLTVGPQSIEDMLVWSQHLDACSSLHGYRVIGESYAQRQYVDLVSTPIPVNVLPGRADLVSLQAVLGAVGLLDGPIPEMDDLWFSAMLERLEVNSYVVPTSGARIHNLPGHENGACAKENHYKKREVVFRQYFGFPPEAS